MYKVVNDKGPVIRKRKTFVRARVKGVPALKSSKIQFSKWTFLDILKKGGYDTKGLFCHSDTVYTQKSPFLSGKVAKFRIATYFI